MEKVNSNDHAFAAPQAPNRGESPTNFHPNAPQNWSKAEIFEQLKAILAEVAPAKIVDEITPESSLLDDYGFDSIEIIDTLLKIQERFLGDDPDPLDLESFLSGVYASDNGNAMSVKAICDLISGYFEMKVTKER
jgi:acyl carrier protein